MRFLHKPFVVLLLVWYLPACIRTFEPTDLSPQEAVAEENDIQVKVTESGGTRAVRLTDPCIMADSIGGTACPYRPCSANETAWAAPLSSVQSVETRKVSASGSAGALVGVAAVGVAAFLVVGAVALVFIALAGGPY